MHSALYQGRVTHTRLKPKRHHFSYAIAYLYLDLDELEPVFQSAPWLLGARWRPLVFRREDYLGDPSMDLKEAVYQRIEAEHGPQARGPVRVLSHWRSFGLQFNPLSTYYCFDASGSTLRFIIAEVTNTPWLRRQCYVIDARAHEENQDIVAEFDKQMTVSPFNPLNMQYRWACNNPDQNVYINIENRAFGQRIFMANLNLQRRALKQRTLLGFVLRFPFVCIQVLAAIYWQALRLYVKGIAFLGKDKVLQKESGEL